MSVILGSGSPRRLELLRSIGVEPRVVSPDIDESVLEGELPADYVRRLASAKLDAVMKNVGAVNVGAIVIAADTTVDVDGIIFGKPVDDAEAVKMLLALSGRRHQVHTGFAVAVAGPGCRGVDWDGHVEVVSSTVTFRSVPIPEIIAYVDSGEPRDKAGAYAIQGGAAGFVEQVEGSLNAIIGLPIERLTEICAALGAPLR
jgi:septum formation protein